LTLRAAENVTQTAASFITTGALNTWVDTPDTDAAGGVSTYSGAVAVTTSTLWGNADADTLNTTGANDTVWAGGGNDLVDLSSGGNDTAMGEAGNDRFFFGAAMTGADIVVGGTGADSIILKGNYPGLTFGAGAMNRVEIIRLLSADVGTFDYVITMADGNCAAGEFITINAQDLEAGETLTFSALAETNGFYRVNGGAGSDIAVGGAKNDELAGWGGNDSLYGGLGDDLLTGGAGTDFLNGGGGSDTFVYASAFDSTSSSFDRIDRFEPLKDWIDLPTIVTGWTGNITAGSLTIASFDADLASAVNAALQPNSAVLFTPDTGDFVGRIFGIVDADGDGNYIAGADFVFEFVLPLMSPDTTSAYFI